MKKIVIIQSVTTDYIAVFFDTIYKVLQEIFDVYGGSFYFEESFHQFIEIFKILIFASFFVSLGLVTSGWLIVDSWQLYLGFGGVLAAFTKIIIKLYRNKRLWTYICSLFFINFLCFRLFFLPFFSVTI